MTRHHVSGATRKRRVTVIIIHDGHVYSCHDGVINVFPSDTSVNRNPNGIPGIEIAGFMTTPLTGGTVEAELRAGLADHSVPGEFGGLEKALEQAAVSGS
jgi:hypothetical protein